MRNDYAPDMSIISAAPPPCCESNSCNIDFSVLSGIFGISLKNKELFQMALTHKSYTGDDCVSGNNTNVLQHMVFKRGAINTRLEFLGDSVAGMVVSEYLFRQYPDRAEGYLSKIKAKVVSRSNLSKKAVEIELGNFTLTGTKEKKAMYSVASSLPGCMLEALFGAFFLDGGYGTAQKAVLSVLEKDMADLGTAGNISSYKTILQEYLQKENLPLPVYKVTGSYGPQHKKKYSVSVYFKDILSAEGKGSSLKKAENEAAKNALQFFPPEEK